MPEAIFGVIQGLHGSYLGGKRFCNLFTNLSEIEQVEFMIAADGMGQVCRGSETDGHGLES